MSMKLVDYIHQLVSGSLSFTQYPLVSFTSDHYPYLFVSLLRSYVRQQVGIQNCVSIDEPSQLAGALSASQQTSLFPQATMYLYNRFEQLESKKTSFSGALSQYQGDHVIMIFAKEPIQGSTVHIELEGAIDLLTFKALMLLAGADITDRVQTTLKALLFRAPSLTLEQACLLIQYVRVTGNWFEQYTEQWLDLIIRPEISLFGLSQYFFAKNVVQFYRNWNSVATVYPEAFWVSYWSEQLFRASEYVAHQQQKQFNQAKAIGYRLPFSFLNLDWKKYKYHELRNAHNGVYTIDHEMKNGADGNLEVFFHSFFIGAFKQE